MAEQAPTADWPTTGGQFRKKPVVVWAWQNPGPGNIQIHTLEGTETAEPGAWIVTGVDGERWPIQDDIFRDTYERVEGSDV